MLESPGTGLVTPNLLPVTFAQISVMAISVLFLEIPRNWTGDTWIRACKMGSLDHMIITRSGALMPNPSLLKIGLLWTQRI